MSNLLLLFCAAALFLTTLVTLTRQFHFLQLNSYYNMRFIDYIKDEFDMISVWSLLFCVIVINAALLDYCVFALIFGVVCCVFRVLYTVYKSTTAKKKIVFTARVKRLYATAAVICAVVLALCFFDVIYPSTGVAIAALLGLFSPVFAMAVNLINAPIERSVRNYYINDAKKILKTMPNMKIIGLTGSYGKTSTKHILGRILSEKYNTLITPGGFNTPMGVVITVRKHLKAGTEIFIVEMGAKNIGDIKELCELVHPQTGVITSVGPQHLNTFGSIENVAKTKFELADEVRTHGGRMYLNYDNEYILDRAGSYDSVLYGTGEKAQVKAENITCSKNGLSFDCTYKNKKLHLTTSLLGMHNVSNILASVGIAIDLGVEDTDIMYAVESLKPAEHRLELKPLFGGALLIDDAYNANPAGSAEAMRVIGSFAPMKRIVVTPGLVELGEKEYECNKALGYAAAENADIIIFVGEKRSIPLKEGALEKGFDEKNLYIAKTFNDAVEIFKPMCDKNTVVIFENDLPDNYAK